MSSYVSGYTHVVDAMMPQEKWETVFFSLASLKAHLQAMPGFQHMAIAARDDQENEQIIISVSTHFEYQDQLLLWLEGGITVDFILESIDPELQMLNVEVREVV